MLSNYRGKYMGEDNIYKAQILPLARAPVHPVATHVICRNTLLRFGIASILSDTHFMVADEAVDDWSDPSGPHEKTRALVLLCEVLPPDAYLEQVEKLKTRCPSVRVVILADHLDLRSVLQLCMAGLDGLCPTSMSRDALLKALELVMLGETYLPASLSFELFQQETLPKVKSGTPVGSHAGPGALGHLSDRETQILHSLTQGASNKIIARELGVAEATVKVHVKSILRKLKASNRTQAAMWAQEHLAPAIT